jgi:hypothetical protein
MSIRWTRTALIANGKFMEAVSWAKETAGYVEKKWGTPPVHVWIDSLGQVGTMRWSMDLTDLAQFEKIQGMMMMDQSYWQLVDKAFKNNLFVDGSSNDVISRQV